MAPTASPPLLSPESVARLPSLHLVARTVVDGFISGLHRSIHQGSSVEFAQHRQFAPGDDPRRLDWRVWAKTDRWYLRQYEEETNARVYLLLDTSASMGYQSAGLSKLRYGACLAASLAYLATRQKDPVGLALFDRSVHQFLAARVGPRHLQRVLGELEALQPGRPTAIVPSLHWAAERIRRRGLVVVLSDLLDDPAPVISALAYFRHKKHEVIVFHVLDPAERSFPFPTPLVLADPESRRRIRVDGPPMRRAYRREFESWLTAYRRGFAAHAIDYAVLDTATPWEIALGQYLGRRGKRP